MLIALVTLPCFTEKRTFAAILQRKMIRYYFALFFLALFMQATFYPAVIFQFYVEDGNATSARTLPDDFPDNGMACYFGFSNNEEETHGENHNPLLNHEHTSTVFLETERFGKYHVRLNSDHKSNHPEVTTPPPEVA